MREPTPRNSRFAIAGTLAAALLVGGAGFWLGRSTTPAPRALVVPPPQASTAREERPAAAARTLGRFELAALVAEAADALASGAAPSTALADSVGQRVDLVLPFGCDGPAGEDSAAPLRWRYDAAAGALRVHVAPTQWAPADWGAAEDAGPAAASGLRGFWVTRPWSTSDRCPAAAGSAVAPDAQPVTLPGQTLAVALVGSAPAADAGDEAGRDAPRVFETVQRIAADAVPAAGLRVRLTGRLGRLPGGAPLRCVQPAGIEQRPLCIAALDADELRIEDAATGAVLGAWPLDRD